MIHSHLQNCLVFLAAGTCARELILVIRAPGDSAARIIHNIQTHDVTFYSNLQSYPYPLRRYTLKLKLQLLLCILLFIVRHEAEVKGFTPPLDCQDGAARVYHPIVHGLNPNNAPYFAVFLKDFKPQNW